MKKGLFSRSCTSVAIFALAAWCVVSATVTGRAQEARALLSVTTNNFVVVPRAALGREFLLSASFAQQSGAPTGFGLAGRVVRFELFPDGLDLYEAVDGLVVTKELPARRLITTFKIVAQDDGRFVIDFNQGMRRLMLGSWTDGRFDHDEALEIPESRVFRAEVDGDYLMIFQAVQARSRDGDANREMRAEVRYFISPYAPSAKPGKEQHSPETRHARFFETSPLLEETTGRESAKMARFDIEKPVVFYFSANTPTNYVQAVRDGILYWNRAFGREVVKAEKAPPGVTAPDATRNVIQWVPWDSAGVAYADLLLDPRTGESKHGQVYLTSVFATDTRSSVRRLLRALNELTESKDPKKRPAATLPGLGFLGRAPGCELDSLDFALDYSKGLQDLLADDKLTDATVLRASQDIVCETTAHEVGHVLGLRHNFAGSLEATLSPKELDEFFKAYLANTNTEAFTNRLTTSSVMDYNVFKSALFIGWRIRSGADALPYDHAAIQWGYFDGKEPTEKKLLFGTDDDAGRYGDVRLFDYGTEPVVADYAQGAAILRNLPNAIIEHFVEARAPRDPRDRIPLEQVNLSVRGHASRVVGRFVSILDWFRTGTRSLRLENAYDFVGDLNERERAKAHWKSLGEQLEKLGGVDRAVFAFVPADLKLELKDEPKDSVVAEKINASALASRVEKLLESPVYTNFVGLDERKYSFTKEEKELIVKRSKVFFEQFEKEVVKQFCQRLENAQRDLGNVASGGVGEEDVVAKLERRIMELAHTVILSKNDEEHIKGKVDKSVTEVSVFKYDDETRMAAAKMLNDRTGSYRGWSADSKGDLNKALKDDVEGALNIPNFKDFKESMLSRSLRDWYLKQQDLLNLLPPRPR
jgi:Met-zincin